MSDKLDLLDPVSDLEFLMADADSVRLALIISTSKAIANPQTESRLH